jgi:hypothetical protein
VLHLCAEHLQEIALVQHDHVVEVVAAQRPDDSLHHNVLVSARTGVTIVVKPMHAACRMKSLP